MKRIIRLLRGLFGLLLFFILGASAVYAYRTCSSKDLRLAIPCQTDIKIADEGGVQFLNKQQILHLLPFALSDTTPRVIDTHKVETALLRNPAIVAVAAYISPDNRRLHLVVKERQAIARVISSGSTYFLDREGNRLPYNRGTVAYLPVFTGNDITDDEINHLVLPLANYLHENSDWQDFFSSIEVVSSKCLHLYPRVGDFAFEIIDTEDLPAYLEKIKIFYNEICPKMGAQKYYLIKLSYKSQIVCKYR